MRERAAKELENAAQESVDTRSGETEGKDEDDDEEER
jgi:hypothetical protein